jgi:N-methylhydantoinase B/oxoprolinase/acetone carboxylase alpha subunit
MTNAHIKDPQNIENQYLMLLHGFELMDNSGCVGQYTGGDDII